jgi:hypothetical protein
MRLPWFQLVWRHPAVHLPPCVRPFLVPRTDRHPRGFKGAALLQFWLDTRDSHPGFVVVDGDTALDARAVVAVEAVALSEPGSVWTAACRLWGHPTDSIPPEGLEFEPSPDDLASGGGMARHLEDNPDWSWTGPRAITLWRRPSGVLAHRVYENGRARWGRPDDDRVDIFGFGCTYLPGALMEAVDRAGRWDELHFPVDDLVLSRIAREAGIPARLVPGIEVVHVHWSEYDVGRLSAQEAANLEAVRA